MMRTRQQWSDTTPRRSAHNNGSPKAASFVARLARRIRSPHDVFFLRALALRLGFGRYATRPDHLWPIRINMQLRGFTLVRCLVLVSLALAVGLSGTATTMAQADDDIIVEYTYRGAAALDGDIEGTCEAYGAILTAPQPVHLSIQGAALTSATTWINRTQVRPGEPEEASASTPLDYTRKTQTSPLPDGQYWIEPGPSGLIALRQAAHPRSGTASMVAEFAGTDATWTSVAEGAQVAAHFYDYDTLAGPQTFFNGLGLHDGAYPSGARALTLRGANVSIDGASVLHLRDVTLRHAQHETVVGPYATETQNRTTPANTLRVSSTRLHELFVATEHLQLSLAAPELTIVCGAMNTHMNGQLSILQASGTAKAAANQLDFDDRLLQVTGDFDSIDTTTTGTGGGAAMATSSGDITVVGLDFGAAGQLAILDNTAARVGLAVVVATAMGVVAKVWAPSVTVFFTRLRDTELEAHPVRQGILEAIARDGVVELTRLTSVLDISRGSLRHHVGVLSRAGLARTLSLRGQTLRVAPTTLPTSIMADFITRDARLFAVHEAFESGLARPAVVKAIAKRLQVTTRTARKYVENYLECQEIAQPEGTN